MTQARNEKRWGEFACGALALAASATAQAGPMLDAQTQMTRASRQFFDALVSSRDRSPESREKLRQQYLVPAEKGLAEARITEERQVRERLELEAKLAPILVIPGLPKNARFDVPASTPAQAGSSSRRREVASSSEPELPAMDGKDVPREIEFQPSSAKPRKPAAAAVPNGDEQRAAKLREIRARLKAR